MSNPNSSTDSNGKQRAQQIRQIVKDCLLGRADGQVITDESLMESHPDLMPELADELRNLRMIEQAERQADQPGSSGLTQPLFASESVVRTTRISAVPLRSGRHRERGCEPSPRLEDL